MRYIVAVLFVCLVALPAEAVLKWYQLTDSFPSLQIDSVTADTIWARIVVADSAIIAHLGLTEIDADSINADKVVVNDYLRADSLLVQDDTLYVVGTTGNGDTLYIAGHQLQTTWTEWLNHNMRVFGVLKADSGLAAGVGACRVGIDGTNDGALVRFELYGGQANLTDLDEAIGLRTSCDDPWGGKTPNANNLVITNDGGIVVDSDNAAKTDRAYGMRAYVYADKPTWAPDSAAGVWAYYDNQRLACTVPGYGGLFHALGTGAGGAAVKGMAMENTVTDTSRFGVYGVTDSHGGTPPGAGVRGENVATAGGYGVYGIAASTATAGTYGQGPRLGVHGKATSTTASAIGVKGEVVGTQTLTSGVYGLASGTAADIRGVFGETNSTAGAGVRGEADATEGTCFGVFGKTTSTDGYGIYSDGPMSSNQQHKIYCPPSVSFTATIRLTGASGWFCGNSGTTGQAVGFQGVPETRDGVSCHVDSVQVVYSTVASADCFTTLDLYEQGGSDCTQSLLNSLSNVGLDETGCGTVTIYSNFDLGDKMLYLVFDPVDTADNNDLKIFALVIYYRYV